MLYVTSQEESLTSPSGGAFHHLGSVDLHEVLTVGNAIDALECAVRAGFGTSAPRQVELLADGALLTMSAHDEDGAGIKLLTLREDNRARGLPTLQGVYVLFGAESGAPLATIDAAALTAVRTAAVSGLATRYLARQDAHTVAMFGTGTQAEAHIHAMHAVRPIDRVIVIGGRDGAGGERFAAQLNAAGYAAELGVASDVERADVVCTCTSSRHPIVEDAWLPAGVHVNAIGAFRHDMCEIEPETLGRATVVVEERDVALAEAGDLLHAITQGAMREDDIAGELADVVTGRVRRTDQREITLFKSVGLAYEDLVVAREALTRFQQIQAKGRSDG